MSDFTYLVTLDKRGRANLKKTEYEHYEAQHKSDGSIILKPRVLVSPECVISKQTMEMIDKSMENAKKGIVSEEEFNEEDWQDI